MDLSVSDALDYAIRELAGSADACEDEFLPKCLRLIEALDNLKAAHEFPMPPGKDTW